MKLVIHNLPDEGSAEREDDSAALIHAVAEGVREGFTSGILPVKGRIAWELEADDEGGS